MFLKSLKLYNIRSYISQLIEFPAGSVLLAGDIGSGKSSILLAIEFALFGIKPGELSGDALLRHGAKQGSVELVFEINGREIIVNRTLKRIKDNVGQSSGYIIIDGIKQELMPKEIRAKIFELLNYPESLVAKGQDLIYRFTVYTPQEQMKRIIYEDKDKRLDTLRKVFNIDKYKHIRENSIIFVRTLKERRDNFEGRTNDMDEKNKLSEKLRNEIKLLAEREKDASDRLDVAKEKTKHKKIEKENIEEKIKEFNEKKREVALLDMQLRNISDKHKSDKREIEELQKAVLRLKDELKDFNEELDLRDIYEDKERRIGTIEKELTLNRAEKSEIKGKANHIKNESEKVLRLDNCPLCLQKVLHEHKNSIISKTNEELLQLNNTLTKLEKNEAEFLSYLDALKKESKVLREKITIANALSVKKQSLLEKEEKLNYLRNAFEEARIKITEISTKKVELDNYLAGYSEIELKYTSAKKEYEILLNDERKLELEKNSLSKEIEGILRQLKQLEQEISEKELIRKELKRIVSLQNWLEDVFVELTANIEKHVMLTVYHEFNELLQQWFSMLIEDENISVRLDDTFSVVVEQNGYETFIENLSGGEKTSVALAYRLALNKVINDVVSQIKTKDILILDEPTDGFSTNQLDRVRDVLEQLGIKQVIIVSHESKIESFVDNVIRINKSEGVSSTYE